MTDEPISPEVAERRRDHEDYTHRGYPQRWLGRLCLTCHPLPNTTPPAIGVRRGKHAAAAAKKHS